MDRHYVVKDNCVILSVIYWMDMESSKSLYVLVVIANVTGLFPFFVYSTRHIKGCGRYFVF